ncbi:MAG: preprotein translocase subunit YajC [Muribaculaceae bacterium]|nr:preprotein translocase subunit YajC [Muribaculaceae bacterium]
MNLNLIMLQDAAAGSGFSSIILIVAFIAIFYFFMVRPQQKKQKEINKFRSELNNGDRVITAGGIYGIIKDIKDNYIILEIADNVRIKIDKNSIYASPAEAAENNQK